MENQAIAVVGAGLVGATAALCLGRRFPNCQIHWLDRGSMEVEPAPASIEARVIACTPGSQSYLESLGVWQKLAPDRMQAYQSMRVWDQLGGAAIEFQSSDLGTSQLGVILEVSELLRALHAGLSRLANLRCWPQAEVTNLTEVSGQQRTLVLSSGETLACNLIIGADGSRSTLRDLAHIKTRIRSMGQTALVAVVSHQNEHRNTAWQAFGESGPLAFLPLPDEENGEHQSSIVWSVDDSVALNLSQQTDEDLIPLLEAGIGHRLGRLKRIRQRGTFPLNQLHASQYVLPGFCLLGDAIHTVHPLAGQGANLGFRDIAVLDQELGRAQARGVWIGDMSILRRYERSRKLENLAMLAGMEAFRYGFSNRYPAVRWLCNKGMRQVDSWGFLKARFARQAML